MHHTFVYRGRYRNTAVRLIQYLPLEDRLTARAGVWAVTGGVTGVLVRNSATGWQLATPVDPRTTLVVARDIAPAADLQLPSEVFVERRPGGDPYAITVGRRVPPVCDHRTCGALFRAVDKTILPRYLANRWPITTMVIRREARRLGMTTVTMNDVRWALHRYGVVERAPDHWQ